MAKAVGLTMDEPDHLNGDDMLEKSFLIDRSIEPQRYQGQHGPPLVKRIQQISSPVYGRTGSRNRDITT